MRWFGQFKLSLPAQSEKNSIEQKKVCYLKFLPVILSDEDYRL